MAVDYGSRPKLNGHGLQAVGKWKDPDRALAQKRWAAGKGWFKVQGRGGKRGKGGSDNKQKRCGARAGRTRQRSRKVQGRWQLR